MPELVDILLLTSGAFLAGIVTGLTGFGTALTAMAFWLYATTPILAAPLVAFCSLSSHLFTVRKIWPHMDLRVALPFLVGGAFGIPVGVWLLTQLSADLFKLVMGALLIAYPLFVLIGRPLTTLEARNNAADGGIGLVAGICGGFAGISGPVLVVWSQVCQWPKDKARGVLQLINMTVLSFAIVAFALRGLVTKELFTLVAVCVPATLVGSWIGLWCYDKIDQEGFRRVVLILLIISGLGLVGSWFL